MADFTLRPMQPSDGPAMDVLMRNETHTTAMSITTHYRHDVYQALVAEHPSLFGVVATSAGAEGLVGMATAYIDEVAVNGQLRPSAHLANLKVREYVRREAPGSRLAEWRSGRARRRVGAERVVASGRQDTNPASLSTP